MKNTISNQDLEQRLRDGAKHRRTTLDGVASSYPVGDYPPRSAERRVQATGPSVAARVAWLLGLGGVTTAGVLGLVTLVSVLVLPDPGRPSMPILAADPQPEALGATVRSLMAGLGELEAQMDAQVDPTLDAATAWPGQFDALSAALYDAETGLQNPMEQEFIALGADLQTVADHIRQQWQVPETPSPTGQRPQPEAEVFTG
ncbi:MAG: hypothetical protein AAF593_04405 [Planctomycetota bacterium]